MMSLLKPSDCKLLEEAGTLELSSALGYKQLANCMQRAGYFGCQKHFLQESNHELEHYQIIVDFVNDRNDELYIQALPKPEVATDLLIEAFQASLDMEEELEKFYVRFYESTSDVIVKQFLLQFLELQRRSVGEVLDYLSTIERCEQNPAALLIFDGKFL